MNEKSIASFLCRFIAVILVCNCVALGAQSAFTLSDMLSLKHVDGRQFELSPDGEILAYVLDGGHERSLWLVNVRERIPREIEQGSMPQWSPDGRQLAFYSMRSGTLQLWVYDLRTRASQQITNIENGINPNPLARFTGWTGDPLRYSWSPNGADIVFTSQVSVGDYENLHTATAVQRHLWEHQPTSHDDGVPLILTSASPPSRALSNVFRADYVGPRYVQGQFRTAGDPMSSGTPRPATVDQLFIANVASKNTKQLTQDENEHFNPQWSPDGHRIIFVSTEGRILSGYGTKVTNIHVIDLETRRDTAVTTGMGEKRLPVWSPDGKWIAYLGGEHLGRRAVFVVAVGSGQPFDVTARLDRTISIFIWAPDSKSIFMTCHDGVSDTVVRVSVPNATVNSLTTDDAYREPFTASRQGRIAWVQSDGSTDGVFYVTDTQGHNAEPVLNLNPQILQWTLGKQEVVQWQNSRGEWIDGVLIKPSSYEEGKSYPLIVDPYGSRGSVNNFKSDPMLGNQMFAAMGYAVFFPNNRAPHMVSNLTKDVTYSRVAVGPKGLSILVDDVMTGVTTLIKRGIADPNRMCLYGFSNGGGSTNVLVTRTHAFRCAISTAGALSDWSLAFFLGTSGSTIPDLLEGANPWDDPTAYVQLSPVYHLDKVTTPMLLAVGDNDVSYLLPTIEMYEGLRYLNRDVTLLRYPSQGHGFTGGALEDYWQRVTEFIGSYLEPGTTSQAQSTSPVK